MQILATAAPARNSRNSGAIAYMGIIVLFENKSGVPTLYYSQIEFASEVQNRAFPMLLRNRLPRFRRVLVEILWWAEPQWPGWLGELAGGIQRLRSSEWVRGNQGGCSRLCPGLDPPPLLCQSLLPPQWCNVSMFLPCRPFCKSVRGWGIGWVSP